MASPEFHKFVEKVRSRPRSLEEVDITVQRAEYDKIAARFEVPAGVTFEPASLGGTPGEWTAPETLGSDRVILYAHGGGYNIGSAMTHRCLTGRLALAADARLFSMDYRLAPEHQCPAPVEDAVAAYRGLLADGVRPERIVLAGDSAGGGLVLAALVALRDAGEPMPAACVGISPMTDLAKTGESMKTRVDLDPLVTPELSNRNAARYLGPDGDPYNPLGSPLYADLKGLPPLLILVGTWEILHDDSTRFAEKARAAGVEVQLEVWEEMVHIWPYYAQFFPEAREAIGLMGRFIRARTP